MRACVGFVLFCCGWLQKSLVIALRELHSKRPPPEQVQEFLVAALKGDPLPEVAPIAKGDDEGVYEYFKSKGVFGLIKVSGTCTALLSANFPSHAVHLQCVNPCASLNEPLMMTDAACSPACLDLRGQASPRRCAVVPRNIFGRNCEGVVMRVSSGLMCQT